VYVSHACHGFRLTIFNSEDMGAHLDNLVNNAKVVLKVVLLLGVQHVSTVL
jgi:hypothetical protein